MRRVLERAWLRRGAIAWALWPVSLVFGALVALRRAAYRAGKLKSARVPVPVIVIGNVIAGGSGKTPVVMALVEHLKSRGVAAGVISRGYGRTSRDCREVRPGSDSRDVGDEPLLVASSCNVPVFVAPQRVDAARALLAAYPATQVILCDDGLQHYALERDVEICVFDDRGAGNGWLLPAGPLREPWPRVADFVLRVADTPGIAGHVVRRRLASFARRADGVRAELSSLRHRPLRAVAGIARPQTFFAMLRERGLELAQTVALPDHHDFRDQPPDDGFEVVCTEKDAVKLWRVQPEAWAVPLDLEIEPAFWPEFDRRVDAKLSSRHGPQTS